MRRRPWGKVLSSKSTSEERPPSPQMFSMLRNPSKSSGSTYVTSKFKPLRTLLLHQPLLTSLYLSQQAVLVLALAATMGFTNNKHIVNTYNLYVVFFVALGTLSTAYGLAIIGSTVGQPSCMRVKTPLRWSHSC